MKTLLYISISFFSVVLHANNKIYANVSVPTVFFEKGQRVINTSMPDNGRLHFYTDNNGFEFGPTVLMQRDIQGNEQRIQFEDMKIPADVHITPDGKDLYYLDYGYQPSRIYRSSKVNGKWQAPTWQKQLQLDSGNAMLTSNSTGIYLAAGGDIFQNKQGRLQKLPSSVNSDQAENDPFVAQDNSFLLTVRMDGEGDSNIYMSLNDKGSWLESVKLPAPFNTLYVDGSPYVTPDKAYLFLTSTREDGVARTWQIPFIDYYTKVAKSLN